MKTIVIRTHGGRGIGLGHLMRCLSIAQGFKRYLDTSPVHIAWIVNAESVPFIEQKGFRAFQSERFSTQEESLFREMEPDCILFDAYGTDNSYLSFLKSLTNRLILVDDNNDQYLSGAVDAVINGNLHAEGLPYEETLPRAKRWLGPFYLPMKEEYWEVDAIEVPSDFGVLVTVGGSDPLHLLEKLARALESYPYRKTLVIGPAFEPSEIQRLYRSFSPTFDLALSPSSLKPYIQRAGVVLTAAGSTVYEILRLGRIPVIFELAENQKWIGEALRASGVCNLGWYESLSAERVLHAVSTTAGEKNILTQTYRNLFSRFDGQGVRRIVQKIEALIARDA